jgi:hypothetical protein
MIFKKGDKVYDHAYGWGEVTRIKIQGSFIYPVWVVFLIGEQKAYTGEGQQNEYGKATLSFTEYTLEGFSQVRPKEPLPFNKGDVCYFRSKDDVVWVTNVFEKLRECSNKYCFSSGFIYYQMIALENPLLFPETKIYTKEDL